MNNNRSLSTLFAASVTGLTLLGAGPASAVSVTNPAPLPANSSVAVPAWSINASNGSSNSQVSVYGYCYSAGCTTQATPISAVPYTALASTLTGPGSFLEVAGTTALNPFSASDLTFGFLIGGSAANYVASVALPGFGNFSTDVQSCNNGFTVSGQTVPCDGNYINAQRDSSGNITFSADGAFPVSTWSLLGVPLTNTGAFAIYTNAPVSALMDPSVTVTYTTGSSQQYGGFGLNAPTPPPPPSVPEPATLGLLAAGLAGVALASRRRRTRAV